MVMTTTTVKQKLEKLEALELELARVKASEERYQKLFSGDTRERYFPFIDTSITIWLCHQSGAVEAALAASGSLATLVFLAAPDVLSESGKHAAHQPMVRVHLDRDGIARLAAALAVLQEGQRP